MMESLEPELRKHYASLAANYDFLWAHTPGFKHWMCNQIVRFAVLPESPKIADIGGGTGIYAVGLLDELGGQASILVVEPSPEMADQVPRRDGMETLVASAEQAPSVLGPSFEAAFDLVLIKEAVHHFANPANDLLGLANLVRPGGTLLVVMLPQSIEYPLFRAALDRFEELQPDPSDVASYLTNAGLNAEVKVAGYELTLSSEQWLTMVGGRFMSLLSTFDDSELTEGLEEIRRDVGTATEVTFRDTFAFVVGRRPGA